MLSDREISKLIQPIVDRQERINVLIVQKIAKRVGEIKNLSPSQVYKIENILKSGEDLDEITREMSYLTDVSAKEIETIIYEVAEDNYADLKSLYEYKQIEYKSFKHNSLLQDILKALASVALVKFFSYLNNQVFTIRDLSNPKRLVPMNITDTYNSVIDEAYQNLIFPQTFDVNMSRTLHQLANSGTKTFIDGTYIPQTDSFIKNFLLKLICDVSQAVQDEVGKQVQADGVELSAHEMSAPDHEPIQGHQFTIDEFIKLQTEQNFEDVDGEKFEAIARAIGQYNCRHFTRTIIVGVTKPLHSKEELQTNIERNHKGYTDSKGKHRTLYECTQYQRELERKIRQAKLNIIAGTESKNRFLTDSSRIMLNKYTSIYNLFSKECGIPAKPENCKVN